MLIGTWFLHHKFIFAHVAVHTVKATERKPWVQVYQRKLIITSSRPVNNLDIAFPILFGGIWRSHEFSSPYYSMTLWINLEGFLEKVLLDCGRNGIVYGEMVVQYH